MQHGCQCGVPSTVFGLRGCRPERIGCERVLQLQQLTGDRPAPVFARAIDAGGVHVEQGPVHSLLWQLGKHQQCELHALPVRTGVLQSKPPPGGELQLRSAIWQGVGGHYQEADRRMERIRRHDRPNWRLPDVHDAVRRIGIWHQHNKRLDGACHAGLLRRVQPARLQEPRWHESKPRCVFQHRHLLHAGTCAVQRGRDGLRGCACRYRDRPWPVQLGYSDPEEHAYH